MQQQDNQPIDIEYKKIVDWLYERRKIPEDWPKKLKACKLKLTSLVDESSAFQDEKIKGYVQQNRDSFSYYNLSQIIDLILQSDEGKQKNIFGQYQSKTVKNWIALQTFYQKDNLHIIDTAKILSQSVQFEIPGLKKTLITLESQLNDSIMKVQDQKNAIKIFERDYKQNCTNLGLQGENLDVEVPALVKILPKHFDDFCQMLRDPQLQGLLDYYYKATLYFNQKQDPKKLKLKLIQFMLKEGDTPIAYWNAFKNGQEITDSLNNQNQIKYKWYEEYGTGSKKQDSKIDWQVEIQAQGFGAEQQQQNNVIDWDIQVEKQDDKQKQENTGIIWDIQDATNVDNNNKDNNQNLQSSGISWDIIQPQNQDAKQQQQQSDLIDWNIQLEPGEKSSEKHEYIETILANRETRNELLSQLQELSAFFYQRCNEIKGYSSNALLFCYDQSGQEGIFDIGLNVLENYQVVIQKLIHAITNFQIRQLFILKEQPKAQERIISNLNIFKKNIQKTEQNIISQEKKIESTKQLIIDSKKKLQKLVIDTLEQKQFIEQLLKSLIKRTVIIIGDIQKIKSLL